MAKDWRDALAQEKERVEARLAKEHDRQRELRSVRSPDGNEYLVRVVRRGVPLRDLDGQPTGNAVGLVATTAQLAFYSGTNGLSRLRGAGWCVGVLRQRRRHLSQVIHKSYYSEYDAALNAADELVQQLTHGAAPFSGA